MNRVKSRNDRSHDDSNINIIVDIIIIMVLLLLLLLLSVLTNCRKCYFRTPQSPSEITDVRRSTPL